VKPQSQMDESLCNSDKYAVFVCFKGWIFGGKEKYQKGRTCLQDCKFLYLLNIC
jgi:hypothetical protein